MDYEVKSIFFVLYHTKNIIILKAQQAKQPLNKQIFKQIFLLQYILYL